MYLESTDQRPVLKIAIINIFFLKGSCNFQIGTIGRMRIAKSDRTLNIPEAIYIAWVLRQWPVVISRFQIFFLGVHAVISKIKSVK